MLSIHLLRTATFGTNLNNLRFHQDVKPVNILILSKGLGNPSEYDFTLADLGLSHFERSIGRHGTISAQDSHGTRVYGKYILLNFRDESVHEADFHRQEPLSVIEEMHSCRAQRSKFGRSWTSGP